MRHVSMEVDFSKANHFGYSFVQFPMWLWEDDEMEVQLWFMHMAP